MNNLKIITSTTRPGRKGISVAKWFKSLAEQTGNFNVELLDVAEIGLPLMDEPNHPSMQQYEHDHTKEWSATISSADAIVIVLTEYNFGFPAPIKNAIDYLFHEWKHKPVAFVSYGGASGGLRSVQMLKQVISALHMIQLTEAVSIPFVANYMTEEGEFQPDENTLKTARNVLSELPRFCEASKLLRNK